jgi:nucleoside-diphosphate-sugar epimerase
MQNNKVLITGASGFVGSHILNKLMEDGFSCQGLYKTSYSSLINAEWIQGDLLDPVDLENKLSDVNTIVHAAGMVSYQQKDQDKLLSANYYATKELVNLALHKGIENLLYISSSSTLIRSADPLLISVHSKGTPVFNSFYAKTKFLAELEVWRAAAEGMKVCVLYPSLIIGDWDWNKSSMQIFQKVKTGISHYPPGNLGVVSAVDLAKIVSIICGGEIKGQQLLINAEVWTYRDFLNEISSVIGRGPIKHEANKLQAYLMSMQNTLQSYWNRNQMIITKETIKSSFTKFRYESNLDRYFPDFKYQDIRGVIHDIVQKKS